MKLIIKMDKVQNSGDISPAGDGSSGEENPLEEIPIKERTGKKTNENEG